MLAAELGSLRLPGVLTLMGRKGHGEQLALYLALYLSALFFLNLRQDLSRSMVTLRSLQSSWLTAWGWDCRSKSWPQVWLPFLIFKAPLLEFFHFSKCTASTPTGSCYCISHGGVISRLQESSTILVPLGMQNLQPSRPRP